MPDEKILYHPFDLAGVGYYIPVTDADNTHAWLKVTEAEAIEGPYILMDPTGTVSSSGF